MDNREAIDELIIVRNVYDGMREAYKPCVEAIDMAISALQAQEAKTQLSAEGTTFDLISRQAAVALANSLKDDLPDDERMADTVMAHNEGILEYQTKLSLLPSAHSEIEERKEESAQNVPKEDLISRKEAIDALRVAYWDDNIQSAKDDPCIVDALTDWAIRQVKALPSAQSEPQWIPVSERLPDDLGDYLVSIKRIGWNMEEYVENDIAYWDDLEGFHKADEVLAWMPLPEPYRAERRTDKCD